MHPYCFFNGKIVKTNKPHIMLDDISILRGFGAFDFFRVYNGAPFMFFEHFERFTNSAKMLGMSIPYEESFLRGVINKLMKKNKTKFAHVRMVLTGGKTLNGLEPSTPNFFILFEEFNDLPEYMFLDGVKIIFLLNLLVIYERFQMKFL
jgi:D-alanine transaminase/branched-chain amino acid aminotransferase